MKTQLWKIFKGALIAGVGALFTYLAEMLPNVDFGNMTPVVVAGFSVLANIVRKILTAWGAKVAVGTLAVLLLAMPVAARNLVPPFSHGPSIPFYTISWDKAGTMSSDFLQAGAGYTFKWNFYPDDSGQISKLSVGVPVFFNVAGNGGDPATTRFFVGLTAGTYNDLLAFGPALKLMEAREGEAPTGVFDSGFRKENVSLLFSFNINFGAGKKPELSPRSVGSAAATPVPPPNFVKFW